MTSRKFPAFAALVGVVIAVGLFFVLKDDTSDEDVTRATEQAAPQVSKEPDRSDKPEQPPPPKRPAVPTIEVVNGQPVGGVQKLKFESGTTIRFRVESDTAAEVHLHGYDVTKDVRAGGAVKFNVPAKIEGIFEMELEETATRIAEISVVPG